MSSCGSPKNSSPPLSSSPTSSRSSTPTVCFESPPMPSSSALPASRVEVGEQRAQVGQVEQRQALVVGVVEDQPEALLLRLVGPQNFREELRAEVGHGGANGTPGPMPPSERNSTGKPVGSTVSPSSLRSVGRRVRLAGRREPGEVALHVGEEHGDARPPRAARRASCSVSSCRCRWRPRSARGGSSSPAAPGPPPRPTTLPHGPRVRARLRDPRRRRPRRCLCEVRQG